ncbi:hypothetical protein Tsubulata_011851 [Turnera subulata]|uniref:CCHC-type domain-containing protein n=1 Tax=Turnera subulata TaxID=218843 RepID=A0A9Q0G1I3_9ROSI|nr:hypothetical protein Tsubulata_011851 [Turnera subulata]
MAGVEVNGQGHTNQEGDEDTLVLPLHTPTLCAPKPTLILVGKLWSERGFNGRAFMQTMTLLWAVKKDLQISELAKNLFMFKFTDERDKKKVLDGELWHFDHHVLIHDLPFQYRDPKIAMMIGKKLGFLMEVYEEEGWDMETFFRVRVLIDLGQPLHRSLTVSLPQGEPFYVLFKYEGLPNFCLVCGWLGHTMKDCTYGSDDDEEEKPHIRYNEEIRAPPFRRKLSMSKAPPFTGRRKEGSTEKGYPNHLLMSRAKTRAQKGKPINETVTELTEQFASLESAPDRGKSNYKGACFGRQISLIPSTLGPAHTLEHTRPTDILQPTTYSPAPSPLPSHTSTTTTTSPLLSQTITDTHQLHAKTSLSDHSLPTATRPWETITASHRPTATTLPLASPIATPTDPIPSPPTTKQKHYNKSDQLLNSNTTTSLSQATF